MMMSKFLCSTVEQAGLSVGEETRKALPCTGESWLKGLISAVSATPADGPGLVMGRHTTLNTPWTYFRT